MELTKCEKFEGGGFLVSHLSMGPAPGPWFKWPDLCTF